MERVDNLPLELWASILAYLPVKSVVRFRSMSKSTKSIIEDPNFSSLHLKHCPNNIQNPYLLIYEETPDVKRRWFLCQSETFGNDLKIEFPAAEGKTWRICNGVDGLILLTNGESIVLWNPSIKKVVYLPLPKFPLCGVRSDLCLLFDAVNDDYKVVICLEGYSGEGYPFVEIFSLKTHSWRRVVDKSSDPTRKFMLSASSSCGCTCIGGSSHWCGTTYSEFKSFSEKSGVISYEVTSNMFSFIPYPTENSDEVLIVLSDSILGLLEGSIVADNNFTIFWTNQFTIWTIERSSSTSDGPSQYWVKKYQINMDFLDQFGTTGTVCVTLQKRDVLIWKTWKDDEAMYDPEALISKTWKDVQVFWAMYDLEARELKFLSLENKGVLVSIDPYVESLLLLKGCDALRSCSMTTIT